MQVFNIKACHRGRVAALNRRTLGPGEVPVRQTRRRSITAEWWVAQPTCKGRGRSASNCPCSTMGVDVAGLLAKHKMLPVNKGLPFCLYSERLHGVKE